VTPLCSWDTEGVTLGDWLAQQVDQCIVDASVCDTPGSEKKFHDGAPCQWNEAKKNPSSLNSTLVVSKKNLLSRNSFFVMSAAQLLIIKILDKRQLFCIADHSYCVILKLHLISSNNRMQPNLKILITFTLKYKQSI